MQVESTAHGAKILTGDDIAVPDIMKRCPKCGESRAVVYSGVLAPGTAIKLRCKYCKQFVKFKAEPVE